MFKKLFILFILFFITISCFFWTPVKKVTKVKKEIEPPAEFKIRLKIENWIITKNIILDDAERTLGRVIVDGKYLYFDEAVLKLKSQKFGDKIFWIIKLPNKENGIFELRAKRVYNPIYLKDINDVKPPERIKLAIRVENKKIVDHFFMDIKPWYGNFVFYKKDRKKHYLYFKNDKYTESIWVCKYPTNLINGKAVLLLQRME